MDGAPGGGQACSSRHSFAPITKIRTGAGAGPVVAFLSSWSLLALHRLVAWEVPILGFGNHTDTSGLRRAHAAGFDQVIAKSALFERSREVIDGLLAPVE